jgi:hypothetical protein
MDIQGWDPGGYGPGSGVIDVYNNTLYDCGNWTNPPYGESEGMLLWANEGNPNKSMRLRNNIIYGTTVSPYCADSVCSGVSGSNNIFYGGGRSPSNGNITASINADPKLTSLSLASPNFHLQAGSPAFHAGVAIGGLATDFDGVTRPTGSAFDIGAYQYVPEGSIITLSASPASLAFGDVLIGHGGTLTATITNTGNENVTISAASIMGEDFRIVAQPSYPDVLTPNATAEFTVKFAPAAATRTSSGMLTITSNATNSPTTVELSGSTSDPRRRGLVP